MLSDVLQNDPEAQWREMDALKTQVAGERDYEKSEQGQTLVWLADRLMRQSSDPQHIQQSIELQLAFPKSGSSWDGMHLPDLVTLLGPQKAEKLLRQVLLNTRVQIEIPTGEATRMLARKLALELAGQVKIAPWKLVYSMDATELYEALAKRFVGSSGVSDDWQEKKARLYYFQGLVVKGRTEEAAQIARTLDLDMLFDYRTTDISAEWDRGGYTKTFVAFLQAQLTQNPNLPFWEIYIPTAARIGQTGPMLTLARAAAARNDLSLVQRESLQMALYKALLASDQVEEAVAVIRRLLAAPRNPKESGTSDRYHTAMQLIRIGAYLKRDDWIATGIAFVNNAFQTGKEGTTTYSERDFGRLLREMGRYPEAEKTLIMALIHEVKEHSARSGEGVGVFEGREELVSLAQFYYHAGRYADVMTLIDRAPNWMMRDLADLGIFADSAKFDLPMQYVAAVALAQTGRRTEAIALLQRLLLLKGGCDPAYERLLALQGQKAIPFLDTLFRRNRFEERPLIWKAVLLQRAGRLTEAEKTVRAAIAIDPSDGDEGHGDRMRAYSVLADIREARGDHTQARQYREIVHAIRISEHADDLLQVGLVTRATALYQQALNHFMNAYCIQSRLAIQMMRSGRLQEAAEHYHRAYELMPSSFGRMESHCFGCEGVFHGKTAESMAEQVFLEMLKKTPNTPQLHYLMGYLCQQQGHHAEALTYYREAVALDQDYVNAWRQIQVIGQYIAIPQTLRNSAALNRMRLQGDVRFLLEVTDLSAVWSAVQTARANNPAQQLGNIYPFSATKAALETLEGPTKAESGFAQSYLELHQGVDGNFWVEAAESSVVIPSPIQVILHQEVVSLVARLLDDQILMMENQASGPPQ